MKDYQAHLEKLRKDAAECALVRDLATDEAKREMFDRLARHLDQLADEVERAHGARRIQRRILSVVRHQAEQDHQSRGKHQEPDDLVQPFVLSRR